MGIGVRATRMRVPWWLAQWISVKMVQLKLEELKNHRGIYLGPLSPQSRIVNPIENYSIFLGPSLELYCIQGCTQDI